MAETPGSWRYKERRASAEGNYFWRRAGPRERTCRLHLEGHEGGPQLPLGTHRLPHYAKGTGNGTTAFTVSPDNFSVLLYYSSFLFLYCSLLDWKCLFCVIVPGDDVI